MRFAADTTPSGTPLAPGTYSVFTRGLDGRRGALVATACVKPSSGRGRLLYDLVVTYLGAQNRGELDLRRTKDLAVENRAEVNGVPNGMRFDTASQYRSVVNPGPFPCVAFIQNFDTQNRVVSFDAYFAVSETVPLEKRSNSETWILQQAVSPQQQ